MTTGEGTGANCPLGPAEGISSSWKYSSQKTKGTCGILGIIQSSKFYRWNQDLGWHIPKLWKSHVNCHHHTIFKTSLDEAMGLPGMQHSQWIPPTNLSFIMAWEQSLPNDTILLPVTETRSGIYNSNATVWRSTQFPTELTLRPHSSESCCGRLASRGCGRLSPHSLPIQSGQGGAPRRLASKSTKRAQGISTCLQPWQPEFNFWNLHGGREIWPPQTVLWPPQACLCLCTHTHTHSHTWLINWLIN